jgi:diguanylate cyclase (GGDEF)-like protein
MKKLIELLGKIPKTFITAAGLLMIALLGIVDYATGYEVSFSIFYLLPVGLCAWAAGRLSAVIISVLSAMAWTVADALSGHPYSHVAILLWNGGVRLGFFVVTALSLSAIRSLLDKERVSSRIDFLTDVFNSKAFYELAKIEIDRAARFNRPLTVAYLDIDNFKHVNDTLGHRSGDILLREVAQTIKKHIRSIDVVSRMGGDEFVILMPETGAEKARVAIEKVHEVLKNSMKGNNWPVTFSIGVVSCDSPRCDLDALLTEADNFMYDAKRSGKNAVRYNTLGKPAAPPQ